MSPENWLRKDAAINQEFLNQVRPYLSAQNKVREQLKINSEQREGRPGTTRRSKRSSPARAAMN